jgi:tRNA(fMet)-specific endonuclease VapC
MERVLLDTDMYSELLRAKNARLVAQGTQYRQKLGRFTISSVTVVEMVRGFQRAGRANQIPNLLTSIRAEQILSLEEDAAIIAGQIYGELEHTGQTIGRADPMIAGIALQHDLTLATGNTQHFERIVRLGFPLRLENWRS